MRQHQRTELPNLTVIVAAFIVVLIWQQRSFRKLQKDGQVDENLKGWIESTKQDMDEMKREVRGGLDKNTEALQSQLGASNKAINERLDRAAQFMKTIGDEVGQMRELGKSMKDLQDFLQSPKLRGNVGEQILKDLLNQVLPTANFATQYKFKEGQVVDAIIKTENGLIPIDSKFPMENAKRLFKTESEAEKTVAKREFAKDVRKHINDIAKKYILPSEGTVDFAIMYVPSEAVYYEVVANAQDLIDFGQSKRRRHIVGFPSRYLLAQKNQTPKSTNKNCPTIIMTSSWKNIISSKTFDFNKTKTLRQLL